MLLGVFVYIYLFQGISIIYNDGRAMANTIPLVFIQTSKLRQDRYSLVMVMDRNSIIKTKDSLILIFNIPRRPVHNHRGTMDEI